MSALPNFPKTSSTANPASWRGTDPAVALVGFDALLQNAARDAVFGDLPADLDESAAGDYRLRARVIGERLWMLGYFRDDSGTALDYQKARYLLDDDALRFHAAVRAFQHESGLHDIDGWVGKRTWTLLSNLVNFEPLPDLARRPDSADAPPDDAWLARFGLGIGNRAVHRAVMLRLQVLGFSDVPPSAAGTITDAWADFLSACEALGMPPTGAAASTGASTGASTAALERLFDHDALLAAAAANGTDDRFTPAYPPAWVARRGEEGVCDRLQTLLNQLARIELWLLGGEDIDLSRRDALPVAGVRDPVERIGFDAFADVPEPLPDDLIKGITDLRRRLPGTRMLVAHTDEKVLRPALFRSLLSPDDTDDGNDTRSYAAVMEAAAGEDRNTLLTQGRQLGLRLWDGLTRLWRWIKGRVVTLLKLGGNLARAFYRYATKGFQIVRHAVRAVTASIRRFLGRVHDHAGVHIRADGDYDVLVYASADTAPTALHAAGERLELFTARFHFAARIVGLLFGTLIRAVTARWADFAWQLAQTLPELLGLYRELRAAEAQLNAEALA